ncbi:chorismate-binding protein [Brachybacterium sp. JHP9]|uniref:Chorismate-binding protein n=1 Tax=Brachybacterium equifaecis TaxID=2910770 RepID=A0ABT0R015_9MICO|nr:chorismate-binding protein [Brachybacterium equifaecis]MCL6422305.1 chorismate-binding protein [Brachybacterium equifaecis]
MSTPPSLHPGAVAAAAPLFARFDDARGGTSLRFGAPQRWIIAETAAEVAPALAAIEAAVAGGAWAAGMITYEAAAGLDPDARTHSPLPGLPLLAFGICAAPVHEESADSAAERSPSGPAAVVARPYDCAPWRIDWSPSEHARRVEAVRAAIAEGFTYQANLTTRLRSSITGDLDACYEDLIAAQDGAFGASLDLGRWRILSASPEAFLEWDGRQVRSRPMKGTAPRDPSAPLAGRGALLASEKDRAENIMITDLLRNDLARIAVPGSVGVSDLLRAEEYPTLWTLTSTVSAAPRPGLTLAELLAATFPCGSITGAPKLSTMEIIESLEDDARGIYCGAIGFFAPAGAVGASARLSLSVAIRTILVDTVDGSATYGVGGGITWASDPAAEYAELLTKARILDAITEERPALQPRPDALPIETFAVRAGVPQHLELHLDRLERTARELLLSWDREQVRRAILERLPVALSVVEGGGADAIIRLTLQVDGTIDLAARPLPPASPGPVRLAIDTVPVFADDPALRRKTTDRALYEAARARHPEADDVVLVNSRGHVTETAIANLLVKIDGRWWTPPLADGLLPGVGRRLALAAGDARERSITVAELRAAQELALVSSVRGRRPAILLD